MQILDTNIISEFVNPVPDPVVMAWAESVADTTFYLTSMSLAEIEFGIARKPEGRAKDLLDRGMREAIRRFTVRPALAFDDVAAALFGEIFAYREAVGRKMQFADAQIAAIVKAYDATLITRNIKDFEDTGIDLLDPFAPA